MKKIKKNDEVIVISGKDKGKQGVVEMVLPSKNKLVVRGINIVKKNQKPNPQLNRVGGIINKEMPIHISNVALFNAESNKASKVGLTTKDGKRARIYKLTKKPVE